MMTYSELLRPQVYIALTKDNMGFVYRVSKFGLFGRHRFVATSSNLKLGAQEEKPAATRPRQHNKQP